VLALVEVVGVRSPFSETCLNFNPSSATITPSATMTITVHTPRFDPAAVR